MKKHHIDDKLEGKFTTMKPIGSLPNRCHSNASSFMLNSSIKRCNRYLAWQSKRIEKFVIAGKYQAAILVWCVLAKNSMSYQLYLYNKVNKNWYWRKTEREVWSEILKSMNKFRTWNMRTYMTRYYIEKKNGKFRPVGAPDLPSKMLCRFLSDMCTYTLESTRCLLPVSNHAYRPNRGRHTAILEIIDNWTLRNEEDKITPFIMEFDFKSYFNHINWEHLLMTLDRLTNSDLPALIQMYLKNVKTRIPKELKEEAELVKVGKRNNKPIIVRKGLPQGSPVSPVLATVACDLSLPTIGLTMYADDGIFIGNKKKLRSFKNWLSCGEDSGRIVEPSKTRIIEDKGPFNFCGYKISFIGEYVENEYGERCNMYVERAKLLEFLKRGGDRYGEVRREIPRWEWDVNPNSYAVRKKITITSIWKIAIQVMFFGIFRLEYKGYKWIPFQGIYKVTTTSSECLKDLLAEVKKITHLSGLKRLKDLKFDYTDEYPYVNSPKNQKTHYEYHPLRLKEEYADMCPKMSPRDLMLSTRSILGGGNNVNTTIQGYVKKENF